VNAAPRSKRKHEKPLPLITSSRTGEPLSNITPTLTRPHQGSGNALKIFEYRSPLAGEGRVGVVGKDHPGIDLKRGERREPGEPRCAAARPGSPRDRSGGRAGPPEKRSAGNSLAAIIRHARSMPALGIRQNALRYSVLRLLVTAGGLPPRRFIGRWRRFAGIQSPQIVSYKGDPAFSRSRHQNANDKYELL